MKKQPIQKLRIEVIKNKVLYEEILKKHSDDLETQMKQNNLSLDNEEDIDSIIEIETKISEKYGIGELYKKWANSADVFIIEGLKYLLEHKPKTATQDQIEIIQDLLNIFQTDISKLIVYRERALNILFRYDELQKETIAYDGYLTGNKARAFSCCN